MTLLTGEEVRARGLNPDTMVSIGGKYDLSQLPQANPQPQQSYPQQQASYPQQQPQQQANRMLTGEEVRAMGINPDTLISQGGKYSLSQIQQAGGGGGVAGIQSTQPTINLPQLYTQLQNNSGIKALEDQLAEKERALTETKGAINDNPYLSEATRVGRIAKLEQLHADRTKNLRDEIAQKKADIEMQLNLQTKQFDINSQQAKNALDQFNFLLSSGALDNASGEAIAELTRATGIDSSMINSAIQANKAKNVKTSMIQSTNDAGVVTISVVDDKGNVIKQTSLGAIGNAQGTGSGGSEKINEQEVISEVIKDARKGDGVAQIFRTYTGLLDPNTILAIYNANSKWGPAKESEEELAQYNVKF